jgi:uncharacterized membrane protein YagU involved in acid resistance
MAFIHRSGWANADMIRALGSLVTRSYDTSLFPGLLIHFAAGVAFAVPYSLLLRTLDAMPGPAVAGIGAAMGLFHGAAMAFVLLALVAENHPVERFRDVGFEVAAAHVVGHVAYGLGVGVVCATLL